MYVCDVKCIKFVHSWTKQQRLQCAFVTEGVLNTNVFHSLACCFLGYIDVA